VPPIPAKQWKLLPASGRIHLVRGVRGSATTSEGRAQAKGNRVAIAPGGAAMMTEELYASLLATGVALGLNVASLLLRNRK